METSAQSTSNTNTSHKPSQGTFHTLLLVVGVALVLATLFTAWTPSTGLPGGQQPESLNAPIPIKPTPLPADWPTPTPRPRPLIAIVVGHWGDNNDPGSVCADNKLTELMVNQSVANYVKDDLTQQGLDVILLKEFDPLLAGLRATALVSIHADSCDYINDQATGFKVAAALSNPHPERSARLTSCLRSRYAQITHLPLHSTSITEDMTSYHAFGEIDENTPAAIIETGFLNMDRQFLEKMPDVAGRGIAEGILCYVRNEDIILPTTQPTP
jgi:N-acetylmuramoyl-L-alanine amidase